MVNISQRLWRKVLYRRRENSFLMSLDLSSAHLRTVWDCPDVSALSEGLGGLYPFHSGPRIADVHRTSCAP